MPNPTPTLGCIIFARTIEMLAACKMIAFGVIALLVWTAVYSSTKAQELSPAQNLAIQCAYQSGINVGAFARCAGGQMVLTPNQQIAVDCAAHSTGGAAGFAGCIAGRGLRAQLNEEQQIALQCIARSGGQPYVAASCTATQLTTRELQKCVTKGFGGDDGCFGNNNDVFGRNGWTVRSFNNVVSDIRNGPGPNNDLVGSNGFVNRSLNNIQSDIQSGPGKNNDLVGCNGAVNRFFGGRC